MRRTKPLPLLTEKDLARFWAKVDRRGPEECWLWTGCVFNHGYGVLGFGRGIHTSHRLALYIATGEDPGALYVLHRCDVRRCCNPAHLCAGTQRQNMDDLTVARGRAHGPRLSAVMCVKAARGEKAGPSKLTTASVLAIRAACAAGEPQARVGARHGVKQTAVSEIVRRLTWAHV